MKKKVIVSIVCALLISTIIIPLVPALKVNVQPKSVAGIIDQKQEDTSDEDFLENGVAHYQEFVNQGNNILEVQVHIGHYYGGSEPMTLSIEKPFNNMITSKTLTTADIPDHVQGWATFDVPDKPLNKGETYYIVIRFDIGSEYSWSGAWGDPYPAGLSSKDPDWDYAFRTIVDKSRPKDIVEPTPIDQEQPVCNDCAFLPNYGWQEFIPKGETLQKVEVSLANWFGGSPDITMSIESPLGNSLSSLTLPVSAINSGTCAWVTFDIPDIKLTTGGRYFIVMSYPPGGEYGWCGSYGNPYAPGTSDKDPDWDYTFRTIVNKARSHDKPTTPIIDKPDQVQNTFNTHEYLSRYYYYAQSFRPTVPKLTKVFLYLRSYHYGTDMKVAIRDDLNGADLTSVTISTNDINPEYVWTWVEFDFPDIDVTPYDTYYIEMEHYSGGDVDLVALACNDQDVYAHGELFYTSSSQINWQVKGDYDCCFQTYGGEGRPRYLNDCPILAKMFEKYLNMFPIISNMLNI